MGWDNPWAELHCHSSFSFLDGAATPGELVAEAAQLGLEVLALTDHDGMYGVPQFAQAAARLRDHGIKLGTVFGAELSLGLPSGPGGYGGAGSPPVRGGSRGVAPPDQHSHLLVLARDPEGYRRLCAVISAAQLAGGEKGRPVYDPAALAGAHDGHWVVLTGCRKGQVPAALAAGGPEAAWRELGTLTQMFGHENVMVELTCHHDPGDDERNDMLARLAALADLGVVATGNVHFAAPAQARLGQALAAIRARRSLADMDGWLPAAGTAYLRSGQEMAARLRRYPGVLERTVALGRECAFDFKVIAPRLPDFPTSAGHTEASWLRELVARKAPGRYGSPGRRAGAWRVLPDRQGARRDRAAGIRRLLPDRAQHRRVLRRQRHLVPGPRVGGEFGGLLRARHHQRRPGSRTTCCSSGSCPTAGTGRRTSTWTSSTAAARRSSSTSTASTAGTGPPRSPT